MTGHAVRPGGADRGSQDLAEQRRLGGHRRAAALAGDLRRRAPEVQIDVIDEALVAHHVDRSTEHVGVAAVDLETPR